MWAVKYFVYLKGDLYTTVKSIVATTARLVIQFYEKYVHNIVDATYHGI